MNNFASCLCKKITFEVAKFQGPIGHCHCTMCQKFHGAAFSTFVEAQVTDVKWLSGENLLIEHKADNDSIRKFCSNCGSSLFFESKYNRAAKTIEIALAAFDILDKSKGIQVDAHIYTDSKVCWFEIADQLPQYPQYRE